MLPGVSGQSSSLQCFVRKPSEILRAACDSCSYNRAFSHQNKFPSELLGHIITASAWIKLWSFFFFFTTSYFHHLNSRLCVNIMLSFTVAAEQQLLFSPLATVALHLSQPVGYWQRGWEVGGAQRPHWKVKSLLWQHMERTQLLFFWQVTVIQLIHIIIIIIKLFSHWNCPLVLLLHSFIQVFLLICHLSVCHKMTNVCKITY